MAEENVENKEGGDNQEQVGTGAEEKIGDHVVFIGNKPFMKSE